MHQINTKLINWASVLEDKTREQALRTSTMPFVFPHLALMPDAHLGLGATVGSVIPTERAVMPAAVGDQWFIGIPEIGSVLFFGGLFIMVTFTALTKEPLLPKRSPYIEESKHFHY